MKTIVTQIEQVEGDIVTAENRLDAIERLSRLTALSEERWSELQIEKKVLEQKLKDNRKRLRSLRWENWRSMLVSVILLGAIYLAYVFLYQPKTTETLSS